MSEVADETVLRASPGGALRGHVAVPGDKSISHRALILGGLAEGETRIEGLLEGQDVLDTAAAVRALGAQVTRVGEGNWVVRGAPWRSPDAPIDCGNSGTGARLLLGAAAGFPIHATFTGDESLRGRPMARVLEPLRRMGARTGAGDGGGDRLPVSLAGGGLNGISYKSPHASAQVKSAILLAGLQAKGAVEVTEPAKSRDHTEKMLSAFGCDVEVDGNTVRLGEKRGLKATDIMVPGDPSSAAFPLVAALIVPGSEVTVYGVLMNPLRTGLFQTLLEMGADLSFANRRIVGGEEVADVTARHSLLNAVEVDPERVPSMIDEYPILAVAAAHAAGQTMLHGLGELRVKESDRFAAIVAGLRRCGVSAGPIGDARWGDSLMIDGCDGPCAGGATVATHGDHRIAMSFLVLGLAARAPVAVDAAEMIATSFPGFTGLMASLGAKIGESE
ncbi:MAG TPA: 3-phosphoshikimate 1-carboxyvinyltransferase [Allosphingosinicella sp.]|nr:3-phosphoshikimate 1-carboxyvinyltransferase [Allosphingosinicella sp.]